MNSIQLLGEDPHRRAVERVVRSFAEHLDDPPRLLDMARVACLSPFYFDRVFRRVTGLSPRKFLSSMRMRMAMDRVLGTDASITDICFDLGYDSLGTFITQFKKLVGTSPSRLRALSRRPIEVPTKVDFAATPGYAGLDGDVRIRGFVKYRGEAAGCVCIGVFTTASPEGMPIACAMSGDAGAYELTIPGRGRFHLFAAKLSHPEPARQFRVVAQLVGHVTVVLTGEPDFGELNADIHVDAPRPTDPPFLSIVPVLSAPAASRKLAYLAEAAQSR